MRRSTVKSKRHWMHIILCRSPTKYWIIKFTKQSPPLGNEQKYAILKTIPEPFDLIVQRTPRFSKMVEGMVGMNDILPRWDSQDPREPIDKSKPYHSCRLRLMDLFVSCYFADVFQNIRRNVHDDVHNNGGFMGTISRVWGSITNWKVPSVLRPQPPPYLSSRPHRPHRQRGPDRPRADRPYRRRKDGRRRPSPQLVQQTQHLDYTHHEAPQEQRRPEPVYEHPVRYEEPSRYEDPVRYEKPSRYEESSRYEETSTYQAPIVLPQTLLGAYPYESTLDEGYYSHQSKASPPPSIVPPPTPSTLPPPTLPSSFLHNYHFAEDTSPASQWKKHTRRKPVSRSGHSRSPRPHETHHTSAFNRRQTQVWKRQGQLDEGFAWEQPVATPRPRVYHYYQPNSQAY